ncbi:MAG: hypothetical protein RR502_04325 [Oscillospiraceae bacterium]
MENKRFLDVNDVADYMEISVPLAYKMIRKLNDELTAQGYLIMPGKVSRAFFEERIYGVHLDR